MLYLLVSDSLKTNGFEPLTDLGKLSLKSRGGAGCEILTPGFDHLANVPVVVETLPRFGHRLESERATIPKSKEDRNMKQPLAWLGIDTAASPGGAQLSSVMSATS